MDITHHYHLKARFHHLKYPLLLLPRSHTLFQDYLKYYELVNLNFYFEILSLNPIYFSIKYYVFAQLWPKNSINWIMRPSHWKLYPHQTHLLRGNVSKDFLQFQQYDLGRCSQHHRGLNHLGHLRSSYLIIIHFFFMLVKNLKLSESFSFDKPAFAKD